MRVGFLCACVLALTLWGLDMAPRRTRERFGGTVSGRMATAPRVSERVQAAEPASDVDRSPAADAERARYIGNFYAFYEHVIATEIRNRRTGQAEKQRLGRVHEFLVDFLNLERLEALASADADSVRSPLPKHLPARANGEYAERWLYWRTLDGEPEVQDGAQGPVSSMFYGEFWQGLVIRLRGDGSLKCVLMPRGHLKSTVASQKHRLWLALGDPSLRHLINTSTFTLARDFVADMQYEIERNERFRRLFGDVGPPLKRELPWNTEFFSLRAPQRRGKEPTFRAAALNSETTGGHADEILCDDIVGKDNYATAEQRLGVRLKVQQLHAVRDPDSNMVDIGTRWEEDDAHAAFIARDSEMAEDTSFLVCTILDGDESVPAPKTVTPLGYGKPVWPEKFTAKTIERMRRGMQEDRFWFGQHFNQFFGTGTRFFHPTWRSYYQGTPVEVARAKKLNIYIGIDTASGRQAHADVDCTAAVVLGQTDDRLLLHLLDGLNERLGSEQIAPAIVDLVLRWLEVARTYGGQVHVGCESNAYTGFLFPLLDWEFRRRGVPSVFSVEAIPVDKRAKVDRVRVMADPYSHRRILWPTELVVLVANHAPYDLLAELNQQWLSMGPAGIQRDDVLDAHARAYELAPPMQFAGGEETPKQAAAPGEYRREARARQELSGIRRNMGGRLRL